MKTMLAARYVLEVQSGYEKRVMQLLAKAGAQEVINAGMGYLYMTGTSDLMGQVKTWRGVRAVLPAEGEALPPLRHSTKQRDSVVTPGGLVKVTLGGTAVVGRVKAVDGKKATVVFALLGRPIEQELPLADLEEVVLPEVWQ